MIKQMHCFEQHRYGRCMADRQSRHSHRNQAVIETMREITGKIRSAYQPGGRIMWDLPFMFCRES